MSVLPDRRSIPPIRELSRERGGPLHLGWQRLRAALRGAGLVPGLIARSLRARLGPQAPLKPTREAVFELIDGHFQMHAGGMPTEGRYLALRAGDRESARQIIARLAEQLPELGMLTLIEENVGGEPTLVLRTVGAFTVIPPDEVEEERIVSGRAVFTQRFVEARALIAAANRLMEQKEIDARFLCMASPEDVEAYIAVDPFAAQILDEVDFWDEPLGELYDLAGWRHLRARRVA